MATIRENNGDASAGSETTYTISLGDIFQGTLNPAEDKDWVKVELTAGTIYDFTLSGVDLAEFALFDSDGNLIVLSGGPRVPDGVIPSGAKLIYSPKVTGTYYIHVGSTQSDHSGEYELSLVENTIPEGSYNEIADYLSDGYWEWSGGTRRAFDVEPGGVLTVNITALTEDGQQLARWALEAWTNVTGITFEFIDTDDAHIIFDDDDDDPDRAGYSTSSVSDGVISSSVVNISTDTLIKSGTTIGSSSFTTYIHEIGHALGLGHPGPYNGLPFSNGVDNVFLNDSEQATVMSYMSQVYNTYINASYALNVTPMIADIIAIQNLYGVPDNINIGDTIYGYNSNLDGYLGQFFKLWTGDKNPFTTVEAPSSTDTPTVKLALTDLDGDGDLDLVIGNDTAFLYYFENTGTSDSPGFTERIGSANPLDDVSVGYYGTPAFADIDGDGDQDLIIGNSDGNIAHFENIGNTNSPAFTQRSGSSNPFDNITMGSWSTLALADLDGDGDPDLAVGNDDSAIHYYENTGTSANPSFTQRAGTANPLDGVEVDSYGTPEFVDYDDDDDFDLVVGNGSGVIYYFENTGTTTAPSFTQRIDSDNPFDGLSLGSFIAPVFVDLDGDSNLDLIVGNQSGVIHYFTSGEADDNADFSSRGLTPTTLTIYDNGGNDTLDLRTDTNDQKVYLRPEGISDVYGLTGNLIIARDTVIENFIAGSGNDLVVGNAVANDINGGDGNDRIWGSSGDDVLEGGAGADRLDGDTGMDWAAYRESNAAVTVNLAESTVQGGHAEGDVLVEIENVIGSDYEDVLVGNADANRLEGWGGADQLDGGAGEDWVSYQGSKQGVLVDLAEGTFEGGHAQGDVVTNIENVTGSGHGDVLWGDDNANKLKGGEGDDELWGAGGNDILEGGHGNDVLYGSTGADRLAGGAGYDLLSYQLSEAGITINLGDGTIMGGYAEGDVFTDIEQIVGSDYPDVLTGDNGANVLFGIGGNDELQGNGGDDQLEGGAGADRLDGGPGVDILSYLLSDAGVMVNLENGTAEGGDAQGDVIAGFEGIAGSDHRDVLAGDDRANALYGIGGDDELRGNDGDDVLEGGAGADRLDGGAGIDWLSYAESDAAVSVRLYDGYAARGHAEGDVISGFENLRGSIYADRLAGTGGANRLEGGAGDDRLSGASGDDVLEGGSGSDRLDGGRGTDTASYKSSHIGVRVNLKEVTLEGGHAVGDVLIDIENLAGSVFRDVLIGDDEANRLDGDEGDDELKGGIGNDRLFGNLGDDWLYGGEGNDELRGNEGNDRLFGEAGDDSLYGGDADDELYGGDDNDRLFGEIGNDRLYGDAGNDELNGGSGNDLLVGEAGADDLDGGSGIDRVSYQESDGGVTVDLTDGTGTGGDAQGDVISNVENITGSSYRDVLRGDNGANILHGLGGNDELRGNGGNDVLEGGAGADQLNGGAGVDSVSYRASDEGVRVDLAEGTGEGGHAEGDVLSNIENVIGSDHDDFLYGNDGANHLEGYGGNDQLSGGIGADRLDGGNGEDWVLYSASGSGVTVNLEDGTGKGGHAEDDVIVDVENVQGSNYQDILTGDAGENFLLGLDGADRLDGGDGIDWVSYQHSASGVTVDLIDGTGERGNAQGDVIVNVENVQGSPRGDILIGDNDSNNLQGLDGDDDIQGNGGDDWLYGQSGDDRLNGGEGADRLYGNEGEDTFIFGAGHGDDRILDFTNDEDQIDLSAFNLSGIDALTITSISDSVEIELTEHGGGAILLQNFDIADLDAADFLF